MRLKDSRAAIVVASLLLASACSKEPQPGSATANADALADQLEAKADNYEMLADNSADTDQAMGFENAASALDENAATLRSEANPKDTMK